MIADTYNPETGIVMTSISGKITMEETIAWFDTVTPERFPFGQLKIFTDASEVEFAFPPAHLKRFEKVIADLCNRYKTIKIAILHKKARELAFSDIAEFSTSNQNYSHHSFLIREAAIKWLLKD